MGTGRTGLRMGKEEDSAGFSLVNCQMLGLLLKWRIRRKLLSPLGTQRAGWAEGAYRRPVAAKDQNSRDRFRERECLVVEAVLGVDRMFLKKEWKLGP